MLGNGTPRGVPNIKTKTEITMLKINWNKIDWNKSDTQLAAELGCCAPTIGTHRRGLDKRKHMRTSHRIDWSAIGARWVLPNHILAEQLSCSPSAVGYARKQFAPDSLKDARQLNNRYRLSEGMKRHSPALAADAKYSLTPAQVAAQLMRNVSPLNLNSGIGWTTGSQEIKAEYKAFDHQPTVGFKAKRSPKRRGALSYLWRLVRSLFILDEADFPKGGAK
jgi:hypothetical protein